MAEYISTDTLKRPGLDDEFYTAVLAEVVPALVSQGTLTGKTVRGKTMVLADERLERVLQLGVEPLGYNQQGWAFVAVEAPQDDVLEAIQEVLDVAEVRRRVPVLRMGRGGGPPPPAGVRPLFLVRAHASDWAVLVVRVHWYTRADGELAEKVARHVSKRLNTRAVVAAKDDSSDACAEEYVRGRPGESWSSMADDFYLRFYQLQIAAPSSWMSVVSGQYAFMTETPELIDRVDYLGLVERVPEPAGGAAGVATAGEGEGVKKPAGKKPAGKKPLAGTTAEDVLREFAKLAGAPISQKPPRKRKRK